MKHLLFHLMIYPFYPTHKNKTHIKPAFKMAYCYEIKNRAYILKNWFISLPSNLTKKKKLI